MGTAKKKTVNPEDMLVLLSTAISIYTKHACDLYKEPHLDFLYKVSEEPKGSLLHKIKTGLFGKKRYLNITVSTSHGIVVERHFELTN